MAYPNKLDSTMQSPSMNVPWPPPRLAIFGARLCGQAPVRYIYVDEAGTTAREPVTIVAGIIIHADTQYGPVEDKLAAVLEQVPPPLRPGFISHAKTVWGSKKYQDHWSKEDRIAFLKSMMSLPRECGLAIALGIARRTAPFNPTDVPKGLRVSREQFHHTLAFGLCVSRADKFLRDYCDPNEVGTVVAENIPETERLLRMFVKHMRTSPIIHRPEHLTPTAAERLTGVLRQDGVNAVTKVKDTIHFVSKEDGPLIQIADAVAYGFRRYFAEESLGDEYVRAMLGTDLVRSDWDGFISGGLWSFGQPRLRQSLPAGQ